MGIGGVGSWRPPHHGITQCSEQWTEARMEACLITWAGDTQVPTLL